MSDRDYTPIVLIKRYWQYAALLAVSSLICMGTFWMDYAVYQDKLYHNQLYMSQAQINRDASTSLNVLNQSFPTYQNYVQSNVIGQANRLQQIELIKQLGKELQLPSVSFSIEESLYATASNYYIFDEYIHLQYSIMRLDFVLSHEGQFQQFMDGLAVYARGVFSMQQCHLQREDAAIFGEEALSLKASCELHWYLIKDLTQGWNTDEIVYR